MRMNLFWRLGLIYLALIAAIVIAVRLVAPGALGRLWPFFLLVLAAALLAPALFSRFLSSRVSELKQFASRAAAGDFTSLKSREYGELTELAAALNRTVGVLGQTIHTLTDERNRSAAILAGMVEGVAVISGSERIVYCNQAFEQILEVPTGQCQGKKLVEALRQAELVTTVRQVLSGGEQVTSEVEVGTVRVRNFSVTAAPVRAGGEIGAVLVLHDITELRRLERVRRDFIANVSHEFKTPLTAIQGFAETLLGGALDDDANRIHFVEIIRDHSRRLARLTNDLLKLSRIEAGQFELEPRSIRVTALVNGCVESARLKAESKGLHISVRLSENPPSIYGDGAQLGQVLENLLENALQYTPAGGLIEVTAEQNGHGVVFTVSDTGIGIPQADLERIFERFYRVDAARSREVGGTGLGLSIARHIVEAHGGRIWAESTVGEGSRFHFSVASEQVQKG